MELFLNLAWLALASGLVTWTILLMRRSGRRMDWTAAIALGLLVLLLLPVISMTDDLVAMNAPRELEHGLAPMDSLSPCIALLCVISLVSLIRLSSLLPALEGARLRPKTFAAAALRGFVRAVGVRPPTGTRGSSMQTFA